jgi:hypothetical protein
MLTFVGSAYAGVTGTSVISYMIQNNSGVTANDLHVGCCFGQTPTVDSSPTFLTATPSAGKIDFSDGSVAPGDSASFTLEETGNNFFEFPTVQSYYWTVDGVQQGVVQQPLFFEMSAGNLSGQQDLLAELQSATDHTYTGLYANQNGSSVLLSGLPTTVTSSGLQLTPAFNMGAGVVTFGLVDNTPGFNVVIDGTFTPTPEPATTGLCALALVGIGIAARRRLLRKN